MTAARTLRPPLRAATYETLIGLIAATGMRSGEAVRLDRDDVEWEEGVITIWLLEVRQKPGPACSSHHVGCARPLRRFP